MRKIWARRNQHNFTKLESIPESELFFERVKVGEWTSGPINAIFSGAYNEFLTIGNYCSIGSGTKFILGSEHATKTITSFPFKVKILGIDSEAISKGPIIVEDDVWIGEDVLVLSGVKIGQGSIIGASSLVVKDIPPYAIVGGVPARVIKYRFSSEIINKLIGINWHKLSKSKIESNISLLYEVVTEENIDDIIHKLEI